MKRGLLQKVGIGIETAIKKRGFDYNQVMFALNNDIQDVIDESITDPDRNYVLGMIDAFCCARTYSQGMDLKEAFKQAGITRDELIDVWDIISKHPEVISDINDYINEAL